MKYYKIFNETKTHHGFKYKTGIKVGADVHAEYDSALHCVSENGHLEIVKVLKKYRGKL